MWKPALLLAPSVVFSVACGSVDSPPADAAGRAVSCTNGMVQVLQNGNFDGTTPAWVQEPQGILCTNVTPTSPPTAACMGGTDGMIKTLSMAIPLPAGAASARLAGSMCVTTLEPANAAEIDTMTIDIVNGVAPISMLGRRSNQGATADCQLASFTLEAPLSADPVNATLRFRSTLDANRPTSFFLDTLSLTIGCR